MKHYRIYQLILILTPFVFSFAFGLDIYIPIIPQMAEIFNTTPALVHLTLSLFLFTTGIGQLFVGPFADHFGRKAIFYFSSICFTLGSLGCAFSSDIVTLIAGRFICSLGACGMLVTSFALVRDLYASDESAKIYSFLNGAIGISPTFAPILGGHLAVSLGWTSIFYTLALIGIFAFLITQLFIEETQEKRLKINSHIFKRYLTIFTNRQFITYATIAGLAEGIFFCFFSISPFIIIDLHGIPTEQFGYYFAVFGSVIGFAGFISGKIVERFGIDRTIALGIALMYIGGACVLLWLHLMGLTLEGFLIPMAIACTGAMFMIGACAAAALQPFGEMAGTASAALGAMEFGLASIAGSLLMLFPTDTTFPYGISILLLGLLSTTFFISRRKEESYAVD